MEAFSHEIIIFVRNNPAKYGLESAREIENIGRVGKI